MSHSRHSGFTLLEVILASALSVLVMMALGGAIQFYLFQVTASQASIEQAQLARAIMRRMESDLRSAVWKNEIDFSSVESLATDSLASGSSDLTDLAASAGIDASTATDALAASNTTNLAGSSVIPTTIGLYGNAMELQVDISRIPRIDEYDPQYTSFRDRSIADIPSDIKTVTYFLMQPGVSTLGHGTIGDASITEAQFGLVRRELDRAVTQYAMNNGDTRNLDATAEILAPEVSLLQFRYYDGYDWLEEWDSETMGCLPMAVDVVIAIRDHDLTQAMLNDGGTTISVDENTNQVGQVFRRLIRIPIGKPYEEVEEETTDSTETEEAAL
ncbi:prepilin-type N-terminal cleavage/methylation domain-containing protein [Bremerella cremea]|uniref:prepilin-type N-terminal cleavage/methylation domain-containing protein n=1 Tax=Bremerella cremea TaxID=1031537 RepID=UPI0031ECA24C